MVVVDRHRIREFVLRLPRQHVRGQRKELVERAAGPRDAVLEEALAAHPAVVLAIVDDVDLLDVVHTDVGREHRAIGVP